MEKHNFTSVALLLRDIVGIGSAPQVDVRLSLSEKSDINWHKPKENKNG
jgi:hypothetical protein